MQSLENVTRFREGERSTEESLKIDLTERPPLCSEATDLAPGEDCRELPPPLRGLRIMGATPLGHLRGEKSAVHCVPPGIGGGLRGACSSAVYRLKVRLVIS